MRLGAIKLAAKPGSTGSAVPGTGIASMEAPSKRFAFGKRPKREGRISVGPESEQVGKGTKTVDSNHDHP